MGLGAHQVTAAIFSFLAFALDALAIAAQAIVSKALGAGDARQGRELVRIGMGWGWSPVSSSVCCCSSAAG